MCVTPGFSEPLAYWVMKIQKLEFTASCGWDLTTWCLAHDGPPPVSLLSVAMNLYFSLRRFSNWRNSLLQSILQQQCYFASSLSSSGSHLGLETAQTLVLLACQTGYSLPSLLKICLIMAMMSYKQKRTAIAPFQNALSCIVPSTSETLGLSYFIDKFSELPLWFDKSFPEWVHCIRS